MSCGKMHELAIALDKAGFDSDLIQKIINSKNGKLAKDMYAAIAVKEKEQAAPGEKFALLADLGTIIVPNDYDHGTWLSSFSKKNRKKFYSYNDDINDKNFPKPTRVLKPGDKLRVRAYHQVVSGTTTSEERMEFLKTLNPVFIGAQGAALVFEQKRDQLPKGKWYASFDEKDRLWEDSDGSHRVPGMDANSDGDFRFNLGYFEEVWNDDNAFLCFCDENLES